MFAEVLDNIFFCVLSFVHYFLNLLQITKRCYYRTTTLLATTLCSRFLRAWLFQIVKQTAHSTAETLEAFFVIFHGLRLYTAIVLILILKMNARYSTSIRFVLIVFWWQKHLGRCATFDLRHMRSVSNIRL